MPAKKILIVDDDPEVVQYFKALFEDSGYATATASDGVEALDKIHIEQPDLVTLDVTMPNKTGVKVYREIKQDAQLQALPVIIVSGVRSEFRGFISSRRQVPPPDGYLEKPVALEHLLAEVHRLIG